MAPQSTVIVDCTPQMQHPGSTISGQVHIDLDKVIEDHLEECVVKLRGSVNTMVEAWSSASNSYVKHRSHVDLLQEHTTLWRAKGSATLGGRISIPFQLSFPNTNNLPPSFHASAIHWSGSVRYYVKVVGIRSGMLRRNFRITVNLPFLPLNNRTLSPHILDLPTWKGEWSSHKNFEQMRRGLWGGYSRVETELRIPSTDSIPLFRPFPIQLRVTTYSKLLPNSSSLNPSTYEFPIFSPSPASVFLSLVQHINVAALAPFGSHRRSIKPEDSVGHLIGGFGVKPDDSSWAKDIITDDSRSRPVWTALPEDKSNDKGRWKTETSFQTVAVFKDPPTWRTDNLTWEYFLKVVIPFPGVGNNVKFIAGPFILVSSIETPSQSSGPSQEAEVLPNYSLELPPAYWEHEGDEEDADENVDEKR